MFFSIQQKVSSASKAVHFQAFVIVFVAIIASVSYSSPVAQRPYDAAPVAVAAPLVEVRIFLLFKLSFLVKKKYRQLSF